MREGFRHKGLKRFYENDDRRGVPADMVERIAILPAALDASDTIEGRQRPSFRLHRSKGDLSGLWSVAVRADWRITFRFAGGNASDVDFVDDH